MKNTNTKDDFYKLILEAIDNNNLVDFSFLINNRTYSDLDIIEQEKIAFRCAYISKNEDFLDHLIFKYNIPKHDIIQVFININERIRKKFEMRDVARDMPINSENKNKRLKI